MATANEKRAGGIAGYTGALDLNIFYGDAADWR